jgi:hypothetical protein
VGAGYRAPYLILTTVFIALFILSNLAGFRFQFPTDAWQLLSRDLLLHDAARSLWLLHAQPPLLNLLAALVLKTGQVLSISPDLVARVLFALLGLCTTLLLYACARGDRPSAPVAIAAVGLLVTDPAFWRFQNLFFYPIPVLVLFTWGIWFLIRYLEHGRAGAFAGFAMSVVMITYCRSLYHPVWAVATLVGAAGLHAWSSHPLHGKSSRRPSGTLAVLALAVFLLCLWPAKNRILFGQWTFSTWTCYNLRTPPSEEKRLLRAYIQRGAVPDAVREELERFKTDHGYRTVAALEAETKQDGSRNWNHYVLVVANRNVWSRAWAYIAADPLRYFGESSRGYLDWSRPAYRDSYTDGIEGPKTSAYGRYATAHRALLFPYALGGRSSADPPPGGGSARTRKGVTLFGLLWFPALLIGVAWGMGRAVMRRDRREAALMLILVFWVVWNLAVPSLTDAVEISRMRFDMTTVLIVLAVHALPLRRGGDRRWDRAATPSRIFHRARTGARRAGGLPALH